MNEDLLIFFLLQKLNAIPLAYRCRKQSEEPKFAAKLLRNPVWQFCHVFSQNLMKVNYSTYSRKQHLA